MISEFRHFVGQVLHYGKCPYCHSSGLCAADCQNAPWNDGKHPGSRFVHLLRQRRWIGYWIGCEHIFFVRN